ncbi:multiple PDZ domain protein-like [Ptychodera flava]|uniref:multiple PDZ domain protein-like n=1 Tax=Ptychodera flava TaxID=63121 RepID=UPI00396A8455
MSVVADTEQAVAILERLQERVAQTGNKSQEDDIAAMVCMLDSNLFKQLLNIQVSMKELKEEVDSKRCQDPSEFHLGPQGDLVLSPAVEERRSYPRKRTQEQREAELNKYALANDAFEWDDTEEQSSGYLDKEPQTTEVIVENGSDLAKYGPAFQQDIAMAAQGREVQVIQLYKPEGGGLGFSVVGLKSENRGELGIFVQDIQPTGVAAKDGRVQESDQILAIDGQLLDSSISHHLAIGILQRAQGLVEMVVARGGIPSATPVLHGSPSLDRTPSAVSSVSQQSGRASASPEPPTIKWEHVENVTLHNDGTGLGFGIVGGRSTGVVVKTILPRGVADRDGRLKSGDHILKISDTSLAGMNSEQVANVLRQSGTTVTLTIARNPTYETQPAIPQHSIPVTHAAAPQPEPETEPEQQDAQLQPGDLEEEIFEVQLVKDSMGLGITIAGYLAQGASEEVSGIYVKSVAEGSTADRDGRIQVGDKIIEVDGMSLQGFSNKEAVDVLRQTGTTVKMKLARSRIEAIEQESPPQPPQYEMPGPPSAYLLAGGDTDYGDSQVMPPAYPPPDRMAAYPDGLQEPPQQQPQQHIPVDVIPAAYMKDDYIGELSPEAEEGIIAYWKSILGPDTQVVVAQISKFREGGGLGISLEGTVDIENGEEVRPHHYVRSILPDGPVGQNGKLESGDELLEVNGTQLLGLNHVDVISILKELPMHVRIVVARHPHPVFPDPGESEARASPLPMAPQLTTSEPNLAAPMVAGEGMMKAHSELALPVTDVKPAKSLDPGAGLAMWSDEPTEIILNKGDRGLGFSILDYQDPVNPEETVIVIRSLVPGGVADQDGRLIPGDRLVRVNDIELENCSLERAVQALKGAPKGPVRIGVTKPLPISESAEMEQIPSPLKEQHTQQAPPSQDDEHESTDEEDQQEVSLGNQGAFTVIDIQEQDIIKSETQPVESASAAAADEEQRRIEAIRRDAFSAMNQYAVATGQQPQEPPAPAPAPEPQPSEAPLFRAPPPLNYSSSEELDDEDEEQKKPSDDEKESLEAKRRKPEVKVQEPVRQPPPEPVREPSPEPPRQPSPPPRIDADELREREEQQRRLEAVRREAAMAMSAYAVATGKPAQVVRQPTPEPEPEVKIAPPRGEEEVSIEAMRVDTQAAMSAFAVVAGQDKPEDMAIVSATPIMIEVKKTEEVEPRVIEIEHVEQVHAVGVQDVFSQVAVEKEDASSRSVSSTSSSEDEGSEHSDVEEEKEDMVDDADQVEEEEEIETRERSSSYSSSSEGDELQEESGSEVEEAYEGSSLPDVAVTVADDFAVNVVHADSDTDQHLHDPTNNLHVEVASVSSSSSHTSYSASSSDEEFQPMGSSEHGAADVEISEHDETEVESPIVMQSSYAVHADIQIESPIDIDGMHAEVEFEGLDDQFETPDGYTNAEFKDSDDNDEFDAPPPLPEGPPPPLPFGPPPSFADLEQPTTDEAFQEPIAVVPAATVALATLERQEDVMSSPAESPIGSPSNMDRKAVRILPDYMEKTIRLKKGNAGLGLLTSAEKGNGVIVRTITRGGIVDQDGRIRVGDYITGVNSESMRDLTNSQARSLLRRCALIGTDIRITYIPGAEAAKYLENPESYTPPHEAEVEESPTPEPAEEIPAPQEFTAVFAEPSVAAVAVEQSEAAPVPGDYDVQETVGDTLQEPIDMAAAVNTARTPPPVPRKPQTRALYSDGSPGVVATARWEPVRTVQLTRVPNKSLGISIVGGRTGEGPIAQGIFIKHVLEDSPAGRNGTLKTGDRILEVNGHDLRTATHDQAVEVIRNATSPVTFLIQSLAPSACPDDLELGRPSQDEDLEIFSATVATVQSASVSEDPFEVGVVKGSPQKIQDPAEDGGDDDEELVDDVMEVNDSTSHSEDEHSGDEFGYSWEKISNKYGDIPGELFLIELEKNEYGLGLSLAGNKDRNKASVFIVGIRPDGAAAQDGRIKVGDEILEINGTVLYGRSHQNASAIIKGIQGNIVKLVIIRNEDNIDQLAVAPVHFYPTLKSKSEIQAEERSRLSPHSTPKRGIANLDNNIANQYGSPSHGRRIDFSQFPNVQTITLQKGAGSLGLAIQARESGIFVKDVTVGGAAFQDGRVKIGDQLLAVDNQPLVDLSQEKAISILKNTSDSVQLTISGQGEIPSEDVGEQTPVNQRSPQLTPVNQSPIEKVAPQQFTGSASLTSTTVTMTTSSTSNTSKSTIVTETSGSLHPSSPPATSKPGSTQDTQHSPTKHPVSSPSPPLPLSSTLPSSTTTTTTITTAITTTSTTTTITTNSTIKSVIDPIKAASSQPQELEVPHRSPSPPQDPKTCSITPGKECRIVIPKGKTGLGLSIVGGADTLLGAIIVHEVYEDGAAARDGRLWAGDQILEVSGEDLREATHDKAISVLRQTPAEVELIVFRDDVQYREEEIYDVITVELMKKPGKGLGLSIVGRRNDTGVFISDIVKAGVAEADGRLMQGDQIYSVNGEDLRNATQEDAAIALKMTKGKVILQVGRLKVSSKHSSRRSSHTSEASQGSSNTPTSPQSNQSQSSFEDGVRRVEMYKGPNDVLGLSVAGGLGSPLGDVPLFIASLQPNGVAAKSGRLRIGDKVLSINGQSLENTSHTKAITLLKQASGNIVLEVTQGGSGGGSTDDLASPLTPSSISSSKSTSSSINEEATAGMAKIKTVELIRGPHGLGFSIVGGFGSPHGDLPIYVKTVFLKGAAAESGQLKRGDQILAVNGENLDGATHDHAVALLKRSEDRVILTVLT